MKKLNPESLSNFPKVIMLVKGKAKILKVSNCKMCSFPITLKALLIKLMYAVFETLQVDFI